MNNTPRTDGEWNRTAYYDRPQFENNLLEFARQLERELAEVTEQRDKLADAAQTLVKANGRYNTQQAYDNLEKTLSAAKCPTCHDQRMIASDDPDGDIMNTPCPECNDHSPKYDAKKLCELPQMLMRHYEDALIEISQANGFDNIGKWARKKAKTTLSFLPNATAQTPPESGTKNHG